VFLELLSTECPSVSVHQLGVECCYPVVTSWVSMGHWLQGSQVSKARPGAPSRFSRRCVQAITCVRRCEQFDWPIPGSRMIAGALTNSARRGPKPYTHNLISAGGGLFGLLTCLLGSAISCLSVEFSPRSLSPSFILVSGINNRDDHRCGHRPLWGQCSKRNGRCKEPGADV
jgi:hypothetical protein